MWSEIGLKGILAALQPVVGLPDVTAYQPGSRPVKISQTEAKLAIRELFSRNPGIKVYQIPRVNIFDLRDAPKTAHDLRFILKTL